MNTPGEVRPYGDRLNDGALQLSFSLPLPLSARSREVAKQIASRILCLANCRLVFSQNLGNNFSFYILYGQVTQGLDHRLLNVPEMEVPLFDFWKINDLLKHELKQKVRIIGATIGSDAHTVGLDAILSAKGFGGEPGLEGYPQFEVHNLGPQVPPWAVVEECRRRRGNVVLVSQVVTQRGSHLQNLSLLAELLEAEGVRERLILICGGPFIDAETALEVCFDAGFGPGTTPLTVASYIVQELLRRKGRR